MNLLRVENSSQSSRVLKKGICARVSEVELCHALRIGRFDSAQRGDVRVFQQPARTLSEIGSFSSNRIFCYCYSSSQCFMIAVDNIAADLIADTMIFSVLVERLRDES
jgi:hypothetical protein